MRSLSDRIAALETPKLTDEAWRALLEREGITTERLCEILAEGIRDIEESPTADEPYPLEVRRYMGCDTPREGLPTMRRAVAEMKAELVAKHGHR